MPSSSSSTSRSPARARTTRRHLVAVSYPWLTKEHPDPKNFHTAQLAAALKLLLDASEADDVGVMWDFCALPQQDGEQERTPEEKKLFLRASDDESLLALAHDRPPLPRFPDGYPDGYGEATAASKYDDRGWCCSRRRSLLDQEQKLLIDLGKLDDVGAMKDWAADDRLRRPAAATGSRRVQPGARPEEVHHRR